MMNPDVLARMIFERRDSNMELATVISPVVEKTISAFANTKGGYLIFGIDDERHVLGLTDRQVQDYSQRLMALCQVMNVSYELYPTNLEMKMVLVLRIFKNKYRFQVRTSDGKAYIRVGRFSKLSNVEKEYNADQGKDRQLKCFVAMSFREQEYPRLVDYYDAIQRAAERCAYKLKVLKNDEKPFNGDAVAKIKDNIGKCDFMLADYTLNSSNVYYEEGYADGLGKEIIQTCENTTDIAFDINHNNTYTYSNAHQLEEQLVDSFNEICQRILSS
mgnify:CR=1 FL=1